MREVFEERREVFVNVAIIILSILVVLTCLEGALRLGLMTSGADYPKYEFCAPHERADDRLSFHEEYGYTLLPNARYEARVTPAQEWEVHRTNRDGFRDTYNRGHRSVIVLGDSFTEGVLASDNETYPYLLDYWAPDTAFYNYGVGGYDTAQELVLYRNVSGQFNHSAVVLGYYMGNDMRSNVNRHQQKPQFELQENGTLTMESEPTEPAPPGASSGENASEGATGTDSADRSNSSSSGSGLIGGPVQPVQDYLNRHTETYPFIAERLGPLVRGTTGSNYPEPPTGERLHRETNLTRALLNELAREASSNDAEIFVVVLPTRGVIYPDNPHLYRPEEGRAYWERQRSLLSTVERRNENLHLITPQEDLEAGARDGEQVYGPQNGHLDDAGYRIVAREVYEALADAGHVSDQRTPPSTEPSASFACT